MFDFFVHIQGLCFALYQPLPSPLHPQNTGHIYTLVEVWHHAVFADFSPDTPTSEINANDILFLFRQPEGFGVTRDSTPVAVVVLDPTLGLAASSSDDPDDPQPFLVVRLPSAPSGYKSGGPDESGSGRPRYDGFLLEDEGVEAPAAPAEGLSSLPTLSERLRRDDVRLFPCL